MNNKVCRYKPATILGWVEAEPQTPLAELAARHMIDLDVFKARLEAGRRAAAFAGKADFSLGQPLKLDGDWIIAGDIHVPFCDYDFAALIAMVATKHLKKPRRLLIAGDFFNMDAFSTYAHLTNIPTWAQERDAARGLIDGWLQTFSEIVFLMGNHDRRLQKFTGGAFDETDIFGLIRANPEKVKHSNFGWCEIDTAQGKYRVTHPKNYGINQLTVAEGIAQKFNSHVLSFHEHHLGVGWDRFKRWLIVNGGCLVDPEKLAYVRLDDSKSAGMVKGFVMLKNGTPYLFGPEPITDWGRWI